MLFLIVERIGDTVARQISVTLEDIEKAAFDMTREEGFVNVTARRLAARMDCSTQPIFRAFEGMGELLNRTFEQAVIFFSDYANAYEKKTETPFVNLGMAYISFAKEEKNLFQLLFLSEHRGEKSMYEILNGNSGIVANEINKAKKSGCKSPSELFMKMWIFIHGAACMVITGDYDLNNLETITLLENTYRTNMK